MLRTMNRVLLFSSFLICFLLLTPAVWAQYGASIQGTVQDKSGAAVVGAKVSVTNQATGATRYTVTSASGFYSVNGLTPGAYSVSVEATSFKKETTTDVGPKVIST